MSASAETSTRCAIEMRGVSVGSMRDMDSIGVEDVNWSVAPGDFWIISGLQDTGQSDFLMMTGGMMAPVSGTYYFLGEEMPIFEDHRLPDRLKLGFVFESAQLFNHLTARRNVRKSERVQGTISCSYQLALAVVDHAKLPSAGYHFSFS